MIARALIATALAFAAPSAPAAPARHSATAGEPGLVGTWRLVAFVDRYKDGRVDYPYGEHPRGYFVYDPTGHLSVQIMKAPPLAPFASGAEGKATDDEKIKAFDAYVGYFGTYRVDKVHHVLHHVVEGALDTTYTDTDQLRPYQLKGDRLVIDITDPSDGTRYYRELRRVR